MVLLLTFGAAVLGAVLSLGAWRKKWTIDDTPTSTCRGVFVGRNEVVGTAQPLYEPLRSPFTQTPCVWFSWELEQYRKQGDDHEWVTIEKRQTAAPFWLVDDTGRVLVRPRRASLEPVRSLQEGLGDRFAPPYSRWQLRQWVLIGEDATERQQSLADASFSEPPQTRSGWFSSTPDTASPISALSGRNRVTEQVIAVDAPLYLLGTARPRPDGPGLELTGDDGEDLLVSTKSEAQVASSNAWAARLWGAVCLGASAWFVGAASSSLTDEVRWGWVVATVLAELGVLALITLQRNYNRQVEVKEQAAKAWSLIDVSLQRRAELIPALVAVVEGYGAHERQVQELVAELRTVPAPPAGHAELPDDATIDAAESADRGQRAAAGRAAALAEAYPDLRASDAFLDLQHRYADAEEAVASARRFYNDAIEVLRTRRGQFPGNLFARFVQVPSWKLFEADEADRYVPPAAVAPPAAPAPALDQPAAPSGGEAF
ncbi:MAG: LemA family protein [Acidimicrobiales bacterium]|nr:LemA family protein [Acidimicrobiales bacterium]